MIERPSRGLSRFKNKLYTCVMVILVLLALCGGLISLGDMVR